MFRSVVVVFVVIFAIQSTYSLSQSSLAPINFNTLPGWLQQVPQFKTLIHSCTGGTLYLWSPGAENYVSCFDSSKGSPLWTIHPLSAESLNQNDVSRPTIEPWYVPAASEMNLDLKGTSFFPWQGNPIDRGHLSPNDDFRTASDKDSTFVVVNRAPQNAYLNRGMWMCTERAVRRITISGKLRVMVITRLLYDSDPNKTTKERGSSVSTSVPTHYTKTVYTMDANNQLTSSFCVIQQNLKYDGKRAITNQDKDTYPDSFAWNACPAPLKANMPSPTTDDQTALNSLRKQMFDSKGTYICNANLSSVKALEVSEELDDEDDEL